MLVAVDIGNTGAKAAAFDEDGIRGRARFDPVGLRDPAELYAAVGLDGPPEAVVVVSVDDAALSAFLGGAGAGALVLGGDLPILVPNRYRDPAEVGHDRLVNAAAAHAAAGGAVVTVDLGSAVTVDAVAADGAFLGGAIAPGRPAMTAGLEAAAPALPRFDGGAPPDGIPRSTRDAIREGVILGLAGLVDRLVSVAAGRLAGEPRVILTGGDAALLEGRLATRADTVPDLTLLGVRLLYDRARRAPDCT